MRDKRESPRTQSPWLAHDASGPRPVEPATEGFREWRAYGSQRETSAYYRWTQLGMGFEAFEQHWADTQPLELVETSLGDSTAQASLDTPVRWNLVGLIILAVVLGATLSVAAHEFVGWRSQVQFENMMRAERDELRQSQIRVQKLQLDMQLREAQRELQFEQKRRLKALSDEQRVEDDARRAAIDATDRNARAREKRHHKPSVIAGAAAVKVASSW